MFLSQERVLREFDSRLPIITERELQAIFEHAPELREQLDTASINVSMSDVSGRLGTSSLEVSADSTTVKNIGFIELLKSFEKGFSTSQTKSSAMCVDASTTMEDIELEGIFPAQSGRHNIDTDLAENSSEGDGKELTFISMAQNLAEDKERNTQTKRKSSSEGDSDKNSQGLEDSDLMFKSANEDYVTVYDTDVERSTGDAKVAGQMVVSGTSVELCDPPSLEETSQTLTLTNFSSGSGSQSTDQGSQTDFSDELIHSPFQESVKRASHELIKSAKNSDSKTLDLTLQNIKHLEEHLAQSKEALEVSNRKRDNLLTVNNNLKELIKKELDKTHKDLASTKELTEKTKTCLKEYSLFILDEVKKLFESEKSTVVEMVSKTIREECEQEKNQLLDQLRQKKLESIQFCEELEKLRTEKEILSIKHKEETGNLLSSLEDYKMKLEEQQSMTAKQQESKSRFDEDQQIRFNAIITKLKKEKEQAVNLAHEKIRIIESELARESDKTRTLTRENEDLRQAKQLEAETFCEREKQLSSFLQKAEKDVDEMRMMLKQKEEQFEKTFEEEKSRALLVLEVERQMWEAEREKEKAAVAEQPE